MPAARLVPVLDRRPLHAESSRVTARAARTPAPASMRVTKAARDEPSDDDVSWEQRLAHAKAQFEAEEAEWATLLTRAKARPALVAAPSRSAAPNAPAARASAPASSAAARASAPVSSAAARASAPASSAAARASAPASSAAARASQTSSHAAKSGNEDEPDWSRLRREAEARWGAADEEREWEQRMARARTLAALAPPRPAPRAPSRPSRTACPPPADPLASIRVMARPAARLVVWP